MRATRMNRSLVIGSALAFAMLWSAPPVQSQTTPNGKSEIAAQKKKQRSKPARSAERKIACTEFGCHPLPLGCYPEPGYDFWGNPTGFDQVVCN